MPNLFRNGLMEDGRQVAGHDDRVGPQTRSVGLWRLESNEHAARMTAPGEITGDHREDNLSDARVQSVGLHDQSGPAFESFQVAVGKPDKNDIAPLKQASPRK